MDLRDELLKANNLSGLEIDKEISKEHPFNDETAIIRKTLYKLIVWANIPESEVADFLVYHAEAERVKAEVKERLK